MESETLKLPKSILTEDIKPVFKVKKQQILRFLESETYCWLLALHANLG